MKGNIVTMEFDAIVNAANSSLLGGGGVDGAIHRAAGPELVHECRLLGGCKTGQAKVTKGYNLKAEWIIHTVGPVWRGGEKGESSQLTQCYENSLCCALEKKACSVAFPAISTGRFGYPLEKAAKTAAHTTAEFVWRNPSQFSRIAFVCFDEAANSAFDCALEELA
ncbi:O-acetyl-ADP-ribose deacetylase [Altererythrobacter arenosus]|uniref:O-acetyl-ADP-ribose deacetylase n=1 Tax=Altererythrobacter arenosus TaxID=3032592 RepID=UPI003242CDF2